MQVLNIFHIKRLDDAGPDEARGFVVIADSAPRAVEMVRNLWGDWSACPQECGGYSEQLVQCLCIGVAYWDTERIVLRDFYEA